MQQALEIEQPLYATAEQNLKPTLWQKIAEACDAVGGVEKRGRNQQQNYDFVRATDVAKTFRHELFKRGVLVLQNEKSVEWVDFTTMKGSVMRHCRLCVQFILTDGHDRELLDAWGESMDSGDKAIYKAKTGATKYFLRGLGLIPDEKDDPEADESVDKTEITGRPFEALDERLEWLENCATLEELERHFKTAYREASQFKDMQAMKALVAAKDKRKKELQ